MRKIIIVSPDGKEETLYADGNLDALTAARLFAAYSVQFQKTATVSKTDAAVIFDFRNTREVGYVC